MSADFLMPLRKKHGELYEWKLETRKRISILYGILKHKVILVGTPEHDNMGDSAIVLAMYDFLECAGVPRDAIFEITYSEYNFIEEDLKWIPKKNKLILGVGGGNFGDLWFNEQELRERFIRQFKDCPVIIFPQTILYEDKGKASSAKELFASKKDITLCAREQRSYEIMQELFGSTGANILMVPDIVLFADVKKWGVQTLEERKKAMLCFRNDKEKSIGNDTVESIKRLLEEKGIEYLVSDTVSAERANKENRTRLVCEKLTEFTSARIVITDRLHGMVFSAITGTPCLVFGNNHHKVSGTFQWISALPYIKYVDDNQKVEEDLSMLLSMRTQKYNNQSLIAHYEVLSKAIQKILS